MTHSTSYEEYLTLVKEVLRHDELYFEKSRPKISDYEYDKLMEHLRNIEKKHPEWILRDSPTQRVGEALTKGFHQVEHKVPMLSLANTYSLEEVEDFMERVYKGLDRHHPHFCIELKMDGIAISATYKKGVFVQGLTRGDGRKGDDITQNMKTIRTLPLTLSGENIPDLLELRGEVFMTKAVFEELNSKKEEMGEDLWANPRNAAAGSLKLLDPKEVSKRKLSVVFYGVAQDSFNSCKTQEECHQFLQQLGLPVFEKGFHHKCNTAQEVLAFAHKIEEKRDSLPYEIDGIVVKVNEIKFHEILGVTGKSPRWAVAYKFTPKQALTEILDITVQVGRTGVLTPVAELKPVLLAGSTISRATLHNQEEVARKDIRIGDHVFIEKGGDVIPKVVSVDFSQRKASSHPWHMPKKCPCCFTLLVQAKEEVAVRCPNKECKEQQLRKIIFFASKAAMDIGHLGERAVEQLFLKGFVKKLPDIYKLTSSQLAQIEGYKEKSIDNLLKSIEASKQCRLSRFILGLGIKYVGEGTAEALAEEAGDLETLRHMTKEDFLQIEGVGEKVADALSEFFKDSHHQKEIDELNQLGVQPLSEKRSLDSSHPFYKKTFVLTGTLQDFTRLEAADAIKKKGGKVAGSVSSKVDYVLVGEEAGSKLDKAEKLGVPLLSEEEFKKLLATATGH